MQSTGLPSKSAREIRSAKFEDDRATFEAARTATLQSVRTSKLVENLNSSSLAPVPGPVATSEHALSVSAFPEPLPAIATVLRDDESNRIASDHPVRPISSPLDFVRTISNRRGTSPVSEQVVEVSSATSSTIQADTDVHTTLPAFQAPDSLAPSSSVISKSSSAIVRRFLGSSAPRLVTSKPLASSASSIKKKIVAVPKSPRTLARNTINHDEDVQIQFTGPTTSILNATPSFSSSSKKTPSRPLLSTVLSSDGGPDWTEIPLRRQASLQQADLRSFLKSMPIENRFDSLSNVIISTVPVPVHIAKKLAHSRDKTPKRDSDERAAIASSRLLGLDSDRSTDNSSDSEPNFIDDAITDSVNSDPDFVPSQKPTRRQRRHKQKEESLTLARTQRNLRRLEDKRFGRDLKALALLRGVTTISDKIDAVLAHRTIIVRQSRITTQIKQIQEHFRDRALNLVIGDEVIIHSCKRHDLVGVTGIVTAFDPPTNRYEVTTGSGKARRQYRVRAGCLSVRNEILDNSVIVNLLILLAESRTTEAQTFLSSLVEGCRNPPFQLMLVSLSRVHAPKLSTSLLRLVEKESVLWGNPPFVNSVSASDSDFSAHEHNPPSVSAGFFNRPAPEHTASIIEALRYHALYNVDEAFAPFFDYETATPIPMIKFSRSLFQSEHHRHTLERILYGWYCHNSPVITPSAVETFMTILNTLNREDADLVQAASEIYFYPTALIFLDFMNECFSTHHSYGTIRFATDCPPPSERRAPSSEPLHGTRDHIHREAPIECFTDASAQGWSSTFRAPGAPAVVHSAHHFPRHLPDMPALISDSDSDSSDSECTRCRPDIHGKPNLTTRQDHRPSFSTTIPANAFDTLRDRERLARERFREARPHHIAEQFISYADDDVITSRIAPHHILRDRGLASSRMPCQSLSSLRQDHSHSLSREQPDAPAPSIASQFDSRQQNRGSLGSSNNGSGRDHNERDPPPSLSQLRAPTLNPPRVQPTPGGTVLVIPTEKAPKLTSAISDIPSLVRIFLPAYQVYSRAFSRQNLQFQTIFECFTEQQQRTIQLSSQFSYTVLTGLSNDDLLDILRNLWGLKTAAFTLQHLRLIRFQGNALEIESWITLQGDFTLILDQVAPQGIPSAKELVRAFISLCPFGFMRQELTNANVRTWEAALDTARQLLNSVDFMRDAAKHTTSTRPPTGNGSNGGGGGNGGSGNGGNGGYGGNSNGGNGHSSNGHSGNCGGSNGGNGGGVRGSGGNRNASNNGNQFSTPPSSTIRQPPPSSLKSARTPFMATAHGERPPERHPAFAAPNANPYSPKGAPSSGSLHCTRCGLDGHDKTLCVRKHHIDGSLIIPPLDEEEYARRRAAIPQRSRMAPIRDDYSDDEDDFEDRPIQSRRHGERHHSDALLSPPLGCGFILNSPYPPSPKDMNCRIKFAVDSRCESQSAIRASLVKKLKLPTSKCDPILCKTATNEEISCSLVTSFTLGIFINHQWNYFCITAMIWPDLCDELIICNKFALETDLIRFCLPNDERLTCIGRPAICPTDIDWQSILLQDDNDVEDEFHREVMCEDDENLIDLAAPLMFNAGVKFCDLSAINQAWARMFPNFLLPFPEFSHPDIPEFDAHILIDLVTSYSSSQQDKNFFKPIRSSNKAREKFRDVITELRAKFFVAESNANPHGVASIAHLIPKPHGKPRFVVNCSKINKCLQLQMYPLPTIQEAHVFVGRFRWYASLDLESGYFNISIKPTSRWITRTIGPGFAIEWMRCTQGLAPMVSFFQWAMTTLLEEFRDFAFVYLDDVIIGGDSEEELNARLHAILQRLHYLNFRISFKKSNLFPSRTIDFLGRTFTNGFLVPGPNTSILLSKIVHPNAHTSDKHARTALRSFLGAGNYLRPHMPDWSSAVAPLYSKSAGPWTWTASDQAAWDAGIACLANLKPLQVPSDLPDAHFEVYTDASDIGWAAVLFQRQHAGTIGVEDLRLIQWDGGSFSPKQVSWTIHQREMFAVYSGFKSFHHFIRLHSIILYIDNMVLTYMNTSENPMIQRWYAFIQDYNFSVFHIRSEANPLCDAFSRLQARFSGHACIKNSASSVVAAIVPSKIAILTRSGTSTSPVHSRRRTVSSPATPPAAPSPAAQPPLGLFIPLVRHDVPSRGACCFDALLAALRQLYNCDASFRFPPVDDAQHLRDALVDWIQSHLHAAPASLTVQGSFGDNIRVEYVVEQRELRDADYFRDAVERDQDPHQTVQSVTGYINAMRRPTAYGDEFVIQACAEKYQIQIIVLGDTHQYYTAIHATHSIYLFSVMDHYTWAHPPAPPSTCGACERLGLSVLPAVSNVPLPSMLPSLPNASPLLAREQPARIAQPAHIAQPQSSIEDSQPLSPIHLLWIQEAHNSASGHPGRDATIALLKARNQNWRGRFADVSKFIDRCSSCILSRLHHVPLPSLHRSISLTARIARRWHGDLSGAYPVCQTRGHQYIITFVDEVSGFGFFRGAANNTAFEVAVTLLELSGLFGVPDSIHTDGGPEFDSDIIHQFCDLSSTRHTLSIARAPHTNGVAERSIREIKSILRLLAADFERHSTWSPLLPIAQRALNSRYRHSLGCSPQEFLFGNLVGTDAAVLPCDAAPLSPAAAADIDAYHPSANFMHRALRFQEQVLHRLQTLSDQDAEVLSRSATAPQQQAPLIVGDLVMIPWRDQRPPTSIHPKLCGPYIVTAIFPERNTLSLAHTCNPPPADQLSLTTWTLEGDVFRYNGVPTTDATTLSSPSHPLPRAVDCILSCTLVTGPLPVPNTPAHVLNHRFLVRFLCSPNVDATYASYDDIKHTIACDRFCDGHSFLTGHISSLRLGTDFDTRARPESERPSHPPVATLELSAPVRSPHPARLVPISPLVSQQTPATPARRRRLLAVD